ncbi:hypothetical protein [Mycobacterium shimoidei]|uniref:Uncharacterized protein n=1 Tax=Mycobacterium shimoidei TaxID=29313 RepID=A0A375Z544_MYCSH|nr:hypothetical protein [Mycobacterium shimoidei]MCV7257103.1 hypothetical protein [Mycobacterium shimoidei]SRX96207.1 hypothetical protein MSP7336_04483 [Mycobacterium shimoidei]
MGPGFNRAKRRAYLTPQERQMLAGAFWPVIASAALFVTDRLTRRRQRRQETGIQ